MQPLRLVDLLPDALAGETFGPWDDERRFQRTDAGGLARIRDADDVNLSVGTGEVKLSHGATAIVEKKAYKPIRWLKGFVEVQAYRKSR